VFTRSPLEGKILTPPHSLGTGGGGQGCLDRFFNFILLVYDNNYYYDTSSFISLARFPDPAFIAYFQYDSLLDNRDNHAGCHGLFLYILSIRLVGQTIPSMRHHPLLNLYWADTTGVIVYHKGSEDTVAPPIAIIIIIIINGIHQVFINNSVHSLLFLLSPHPSKIVHHTP